MDSNRTTAEVYLRLLASRGVDYLFANGGTDFAPIVEAYVKARNEGAKVPEPVVVPHENMGVAMLHGYTMVSGRTQAMMVHVGPGTANTLNGVINAARQNVPMLLTAGRTPLTESGDLAGARNFTIHWAQEHFDQAGMLREFVKWDYELRHPEQVETVVDRALAIAASEPAGPVYLSLPREVLGMPATTRPVGETTSIAVASAPWADPKAIALAADWLAAARQPLVITSNAGRTREGAQALERFAERWAVPVVHYRPRHLALSTEHPMAAGWDPHGLLKSADLVLVVDCDVPWLPVQGTPQADAKVIHLGTDPLFARYPLRGFRTDLAITGLLAPTLDALTDRAPASGPAQQALQARLQSVAGQNAQSRATRRTGADSLARAVASSRTIADSRALSGALFGADAPAAAESLALTPPMVSACLNQVVSSHCGEDALFINEYPLLLEEMELNTPGRFFGLPPSGGLGWGLGAALGAKLAAPDKTVVCTVGDGAYMFGNPTAAHFTARAMNLPVLFVIFNNARWLAVHRSTLAMYPQGAAARTQEPPFATLEPSPHFEKVIEASDGLGLRVEHAGELLPALERALHAVRVEGRQALLNIKVGTGAGSAR